MKVIRKLKVLIALDTENTSSLMQSDFFYRVGVMSYDVPKVFRVIRARKWLGDPARPWKKFEGGFRLCLTRWASWNCNTKMACGPLDRSNSILTYFHLSKFVLIRVQSYCEMLFWMNQLACLIFDKPSNQSLDYYLPLSESKEILDR